MDGSGGCCVADELFEWLGMKRCMDVVLRLDFRAQPEIPPAGPDVVIDDLGVCSVNAAPPEITLFTDRVDGFADRAGPEQRRRYWRHLALAHKMARVAYLAAADATGRRNPILSNDWTELLSGGQTDAPVGFAERSGIPVRCVHWRSACARSSGIVQEVSLGGRPVLPVAGAAERQRSERPEGGVVDSKRVSAASCAPGSRWDSGFRARVMA